MSGTISRRSLAAGVAGTVLAAAASRSGAEPQNQPPTQNPAQPAPPPATGVGGMQEFTRDYTAPTFKPQFKKLRLSNLMVQDFVIFGHYDLDMVKKLLDREPALLYAAMDWGGGDFETALGGASHLGRRDIATYLLEKGARPDIFTAAMMGHTDVVKSLLASHPTLIDAKGPHGIPLIVHAKMGGKEALELYTYLQSLKKT